MALVSATVFFIASCKDDNSPGPVQYDNYTQLKVGNYWIYQIFDIDSLGYGPPLNKYDSCYISKDTLVNGYTYFYLTHGSPLTLGNDIYNKWLRDSLHYLVDIAGNIYFSSEDFDNVLYTQAATNETDTIFTQERKMTDKDATTNTPAGSFITSNCRTIFTIYTAGLPQEKKFSHRRYARNIGIVPETLPFYASSIRYEERRLLRYHLK